MRSDGIRFMEMIDGVLGIQWFRSPYRVLDQRLRRGELTFRLRLPVLGNCLVTGDPALVSEVVRNKLLIGGRGTQALRPVVGDDSLIVLEGERHDEHRSVLLPLFFSADPTRHDALNRRWVDAELASLPVGATFSGMAFVARVTMNVIVELIFGAMPQPEHRRAVGLIDAWLASFRSSALLFLKALQVDFGRLSPWGRFIRNRAALHEFIRARVAESRTQPARCALASIVQARSDSGRTLADDEVVSEVVTFLLFGHDTSAAAMGWVFNHLLRDTRAEERARAEAAIADAPLHDDGFPFIRSLIQESMRLAPVVVHLTRHAVAPTTVGPHSIGAGERVLPCMYLAHRNPAVFDDPGRFIADRFLEPRSTWRHAYFPFGLGTRLCAGMPLALRQMVVILARLLQSARFELVEPGRVGAVRKMVLIVPSGGPLLRRV